jgi:hypothetical protein
MKRGNDVKEESIMDLIDVWLFKVRQIEELTQRINKITSIRDLILKVERNEISKWELINALRDTYNFYSSENKEKQLRMDRKNMCFKMKSEFKNIKNQKLKHQLNEVSMHITYKTITSYVNLYL